MPSSRQIFHAFVVRYGGNKSKESSLATATATENGKYPVVAIRPRHPFINKGEFNGFCVFIPLSS
jgi:hypothetical protein